MEQVYETFIDHKYLPANNDNHPFTHMLLTKEEWEDLSERVAQAEEDVVTAINMESNMIRIFRDRKNHVDGNSKEASGYVVKGMEPYIHKVHLLDIEETYDLYKITFTTPWDIGLSMDEVNICVRQDILEGKIRLFHPEDSISELFLYNAEMTLDSVVRDNEPDNKAILGCMYRANGRTGVWEVTLITSFEPKINECHRSTYA